MHYLKFTGKTVADDYQDYLIFCGKLSVPPQPQYSDSMKNFYHHLAEIYREEEQRDKRISSKNFVLIDFL